MKMKKTGNISKDYKSVYNALWAVANLEKKIRGEGAMTKFDNSCVKEESEWVIKNCFDRLNPIDYNCSGFPNVYKGDDYTIWFELQAPFGGEYHLYCEYEIHNAA